jgi:hypothetical protein
LFSFAFGYVFIHSLALQIIWEWCPNLRQRSGEHDAPVFQVFPISQLESLNRNASGDSSQAFGHTLRHLTLPDKCAGAGAERGFLTGVSMADEASDQRGPGGPSEFFKSCNRPSGTQTQSTNNISLRMTGT